MLDKKRARDFADHWRGHGYEKGETQQFWLQALRVIRYPHADDVRFEHRLPSGGYIDVWIRDAGVLIEQKTLGINLDTQELRQGKKKTPLVQALDYVEELPRPEQPRYVVTCNFETFRVYDRDRFSKSSLADNVFEFTLEEFAEHPEYLNFINDPENSRLEKEKQVSIQAGELIGRLYDKMREGYIDKDSEASMHALNVLCVRLVFCLYCEDADLFQKDSFYRYLRDVPANGIRIALKRLFRALDTEIKDRDPYDTDLKIFPYVNGGLFREDTEVPNFTEEMKRFLLDEVSASVDWSKISPTIFGGIFESTLNPETRRKGGMHYTSPENIHKVIDPLFLDGLKNEFLAIKNDEAVTPRKRKNALARFHRKLCNLTFFDPACGSGNFLTETYLCLRKLEDAVLNELRQGQTGIGFADEEEFGDRIRLSQFYGIEINGFAVSVAETALWISRLKANGEALMFYDVGGDDFPLHDRANIVQGNALRKDWNEVLPAEKCSFIMGNPPFIGSSLRTDKQTEDMSVIAFAGMKTWGKVDYCGAWYYMAARYMKNHPIKAAFVSTNSLCQGEQVQPMWKALFEMGCHIDFAWKTFIWNSEATDQAHVHCIILGFSKQTQDKFLYSDGSIQKAKNINGYLVDAPDVFLPTRMKAIDGVHKQMVQGCKAVDGGGFALKVAEKNEFLRLYPELSDLIRPYLGSDEFIKGKERYCFWLKAIEPSRYENNPIIQERLDIIRKQREGSPTQEFRDYSDRPYLFVQDRQPDEDYLMVPRVSSERRKYVPIGYLPKEVIVPDSTYSVPSATLYDFGLMTSQMHNAWMRIVAGRLKSDYRYSPVVYNTFAYPEPTSAQRKHIEQCAQAILDARAKYKGDSLAQMYDGISPMPENPTKADLKKYNLHKYDDLHNAHKALDAAVEAAYGVDFNGDEEKIVAHLFKLYAEKTAGKPLTAN